ncbi:MAG: hypothetical protein ACRDOB_22520 [Streptosporangiaceae bacterium]
MNLTRHIRRSAAVLAGLAGAVLAFAAPAFAQSAMIPVSGGDASGAQLPVPVQVQVRTIVAGGMPGWQIALIAVGAALIAAALAVLATRMLASRRQAVTAAA